jgi:hypothetical protein
MMNSVHLVCRRDRVIFQKKKKSLLLLLLREMLRCGVAYVRREEYVTGIGALHKATISFAFCRKQRGATSDKHNHLPKPNLSISEITNYVNAVVFWVTEPCCRYVNRRFGGEYHLHIRCRKSAEKEHSVQKVAINQEMAKFIATAVWTSNLTKICMYAV